MDIDYEEPELSVISCPSIEAADELRDELLELPSEYFVVPRGTYMMEELPVLALAGRYEIYLPPSTPYLQKKAIRRVLRMGIKLDQMGIIHNCLLLTNIVGSNNKFKFNTAPQKFSNFQSQATAIISQQRQLADITDYVVGQEEWQNPLYRNFKNFLLASKTLVDLQSLLHHPYLAKENQPPYYYGCCQLIRSCYRFSRAQLNQMFGSFTWIDHVRQNGHELIRNMLTSRTVDENIVYYHDTPYDLYLFIWNTMRHANSDQINFWSMEAIHQQFLMLFPDYVQQMFQYMHTLGLNAHFGPETYSLPILEHARQLDENENVHLFVPKLLKVCKFIHFLLVKFYTFCGNPVTAGKVKAIAEKLDQSILTLKNFEGTYFVCDYPRLSPREIPEIDRAVFFSVRCVYCALAFVKLVIGDYQISYCVEQAAVKTSRKFKRLYKVPLIGSREARSLNSATFPSMKDVKKIIGESFIIKEADSIHLQQSMDAIGERLFQRIVR